MMLYFFVMTFAASLTVATSIVDIDGEHPIEIVQKSTTEPNIAFTLPDLTAIVETKTGIFQLEAYKSVNNDDILSSNASGKQLSKLFWVSVGQPTLVKTPSRNNRTSLSFFHVNKHQFITSIQMLTSDHRRVLSSTASRKYQVKVEDSQIVNLILSKLECTITMYDDNGVEYTLKGNVMDFRKYPLKIYFDAPPNSIERKLFLEMLSDVSDLNLICNMATKNGKQKKINTLTITSKQVQIIGVDEELFGPANETYVTRDQMTELSSEMYSDLNIVEDYQMPEEKFSETFIEDMINQTAVHSFQQVPIDDVLAGLSKYGFDISEDVKPDVIKKDMGSVLKVEHRGNKSRIILDESSSDKFQESKSRSRESGITAPEINASLSWARNNSKSKISETSSLSEQLHELNTKAQNDIKWEIEGDKVVPKQLTVAKLSRSKFGKEMSFRRIKVQSISVPFERQFSLHTHTPEISIPFLDKLALGIATVEAKIQEMSSSLSSKIEETNHWRYRPRGLNTR